MRIPPFQLERFFARYEFAAPYLLCCSDCQSLAVRDLLALEEGAGEELAGLWLGYTESPGSPHLRQAIAALYSGIEPGQVLVHSGAQEAIFTFVNAALEPGDHVIVHWPCYQSLSELAAAAGCRVTRWETRAAEGWALDTRWLEAAIRPGTRALIVNCPHNPTGYQMTRQTQAEIARIAAEHDLIVFSDEVYRLLEYDPANRLPAFCELSDRAVSLGVMSKAFGLAGLRIGWVTTRNRQVYERMAGLKDYTTICNSAPSEFLAALALRHHERIVARNLGIIRRNLALLDGFFARQAHLFRWQRPLAGPVAFPALTGGRDVERFCDDLVRRAGVLLAPGTLFDHPGGHFRLGFGRANLPECLEQLEQALTVMRGKNDAQAAS